MVTMDICSHISDTVGIKIFMNTVGGSKAVVSSTISLDFLLLVHKFPYEI